MGRPPKKETGLFEKNPGTGVWYIRYRVDGVLVRKRVGSREAAKNELNKIQLARAEGASIPVSAQRVQRPSSGSDITVGQLCDEYLAFINDPRNPDRPRDLVNPPKRLSIIRKAFGERAADSITGAEIEQWLRSKGRKPATLNRYKSVFSSLYRIPIKHNRLTINPIRSIPHFKVQTSNARYMTQSEQKRLEAVLARWIEECPDVHRQTKLKLRCHPIELTVAIKTGLRKGNQYRMRWEHVDLEARSINLPPSMTKQGKALNIPINNDVYRALIELKSIQAELAPLQKADSTRMKSDGRVFNISENREWWNAALVQADIQNLRWHDLRHTFASRLVQKGQSLSVVKDLCGHSSITMTQRYAHLNQSILHDAVAVLND